LRRRDSTCVPGVSTNQRRRAIMTASSTPSPRISSTAGTTSAESPSFRGPSISPRSTCGMIRATTAPMSAATMPSTIRGIAGRM
jgi:hypothetical protein